jgi:hypothetical protein
MNNKPSPTEDSKKTDRRVDSDPPADENVNERALRQVREGHENLAQRAEWFRRRTGGDK